MSESAKGVDHKLKVGDTVLMRQKKENKLTPSFKPEKLTVTGLKGSSVEATNQRGAEVFWDASFFKPIESDSEDSAEEIEGQPVVQANESMPILEGEPEGDGNDPEEEEDEHVNVGTSVAVGRPRRQRQAPARLNDYVP